MQIRDMNDYRVFSWTVKHLIWHAPQHPSVKMVFFFLFIYHYLSLIPSRCFCPADSSAAWCHVCLLCFLRHFEISWKLVGSWSPALVLHSVNIAQCWAVCGQAAALLCVYWPPFVAYLWPQQPALLWRAILCLVWADIGLSFNLECWRWFVVMMVPSRLQLRESFPQNKEWHFIFVAHCIYSFKNGEGSPCQKELLTQK